MKDKFSIMLPGKIPKLIEKQFGWNQVTNVFTFTKKSFNWEKKSWFDDEQGRLRPIEQIRFYQ